jgi:hypothetical protein
MKNFFAKLLASIRTFVNSPSAHEIEQAVVHSAAPVVEAALLAASKANPLASVVVTTVVLPAIQAEVSHIEQTKNQASS